MLASDITVKFASLFCHYFWYYYLTWRFCGYAGTDISWKSCGLYQRLPTSSHWGQNPTKSVCLEHVMFFNMWFFFETTLFRGCRAFWRLSLRNAVEVRPRWADGKMFCFSTDKVNFQGLGSKFYFLVAPTCKTNKEK